MAGQRFARALGFCSVWVESGCSKCRKLKDGYKATPSVRKYPQKPMQKLFSLYSLPRLDVFAPVGSNNNPNEQNTFAPDFGSGCRRLQSGMRAYRAAQTAFSCTREGSMRGWKFRKFKSSKVRGNVRLCHHPVLSPRLGFLEQ